MIIRAVDFGISGIDVEREAYPHDNNLYRPNGKFTCTIDNYSTDRLTLDKMKFVIDNFVKFDFLHEELGYKFIGCLITRLEYHAYTNHHNIEVAFDFFEKYEKSVDDLLSSYRENRLAWETKHFKNTKLYGTPI